MTGASAGTLLRGEVALRLDVFLGRDSGSERLAALAGKDRSLLPASDLRSSVAPVTASPASRGSAS